MEKKRGIVVDDNMIAIFNAKRENKKGQTFSRSEMLQQLKELNYAGHDSMLRSLIDGINPPIIRIERGKYVFNPKPVHIERLQLAFDTYTKLANPKDYDENGKWHKNLTEEECIAFLNSTGKYEVYKIIKKLERV